MIHSRFHERSLHEAELKSIRHKAWWFQHDGDFAYHGCRYYFCQAPNYEQADFLTRTMTTSSACGNRHRHHCLFLGSRCRWVHRHHAPSGCLSLSWPLLHVQEALFHMVRLHHCHRQSYLGDMLLRGAVSRRPRAGGAHIIVISTENTLLRMGIFLWHATPSWHFEFRPTRRGLFGRCARYSDDITMMRSCSCDGWQRQPFLSSYLQKTYAFPHWLKRWIAFGATQLPVAQPLH